MVYGWTPNQIAEMTLGQILAVVAPDEGEGITEAEAVASIRRWRELKRFGLEDLME